MSEDVPLPAASPRPPPGPGETTQPGVASTEYVKRKLADAELHVQAVAREAAQQAAKEQSNGVPRIPAAWSPYLLAGFTLCGAVTAVCFGDASVPMFVTKAAAVGSMFFGGMLAAGPGLRK